MRRIKQVLVLIGIFFFMTQSTPCFTSPIAIVVNKNNPVEEFSIRELTTIFKKEKLFWTDNSKIYIVMREAGSNEKNIILRSLYKMSDEQLKQYWIQQIFREKMTAFPKVFHSDDSIKSFVSRVPNAIGFISADNVDSSVKVLKIDGKLPGDKDYAIANE